MSWAERGKDALRRGETVAVRPRGHSNVPAGVDIARFHAGLRPQLTTHDLQCIAESRAAVAVVPQLRAVGTRRERAPGVSSPRRGGAAPK